MAKFKKFKRKAQGPKVLDLPGGQAKKEGIFVGIPHVGDDLSLVIVNFVTGLNQMSADPECPWRFEICIEQDKRPVHYARNCIAGRFLESECERLWFVDSDMVPTPTAFHLLHTDADIVAARMYAIKRRPDNHQPYLQLCAYDQVNPNDSLRTLTVLPDHDPIYDVIGVGTGCTVIKRKVLEDKRLWGATTYEWGGKSADVMQERDDDGTAAPPIFRWLEKPNGKPLRGEDLDFSLRAKELGYSVKVNTAAHCGHIKAMNLDDSLQMGREIAQNYIAAMQEVNKCESAG